MAENEDAPTVPLDPKEIQANLPVNLPVNREDVEPVEVDETKPHIPEPLLVRGGIAAVLHLVGVILGQELNPELTDAILEVYVIVGPPLFAWWLRRHVTPVKK